MSDRLKTISRIECQTNYGQIVRIRCDSDKVEEVKNFFKSSIKHVSPTITKKTVIEKGALETYSRFDIVQHKYGASMVSYRELLEIKDPVDEKCGFVIYNHDSQSPRLDYFVEFKTLKQAKKAFDKYPTRYDYDNPFEEALQKLSGFIRKVECGYLQPWFYAVGNEQIIGDYVIPEHLSDDPVYRIGRKFLVYSRISGTPSIKTCLGCKLAREEDDKRYYRLVYFCDGTVWDETGNTAWYSPKKDCPPPTPIHDEELWIEEATQSFREALAGKKQSFSINFTDGTVFNGKVSKGRVKKHCEAGDYELNVIIRGEDKPKEGWVKEFKPTQEHPDIVTFVKKKMKVDGYGENEAPIERVEVLQSKKNGKDKKWSGVFFDKRPPLAPSEESEKTA